MTSTSSFYLFLTGELSTQPHEEEPTVPQMHVKKNLLFDRILRVAGTNSFEVPPEDGDLAATIKRQDNGPYINAALHVILGRLYKDWCRYSVIDLLQHVAAGNSEPPPAFPNTGSHYQELWDAVHNQ